LEKNEKKKKLLLGTV